MQLTAGDGRYKVSWKITEAGILIQWLHLIAQATYQHDTGMQRHTPTTATETEGMTLEAGDNT